jgi:ribosomal protein L16 Arg81 hydroxylase
MNTAAPTLVFVMTCDGAYRAHYGDFDALITRNFGNRQWRVKITTHGLPLLDERYRTLAEARTRAQATADNMPAELFT